MMTTTRPSPPIQHALARSAVARALDALLRKRGFSSHPIYVHARRSRRSTSGVALLVVLSAIMVMTVLVTEMNFSARVRLLLSAHQRDETQAYWLARSGVNIYRLILMGSAQVKRMNLPSTITDMLPFNISDGIWQAVPVFSTALMRMLFVSGTDTTEVTEDQVKDVVASGHASEDVETESRQGGRFADENFLDFTGDFVAEVIDEDSKINVNAFKNKALTQNIQENATAKALYGIMSGLENDQWFYDRNIDRWEIIANLADWVDTDSTRCAATGGFEDDLYNRLASPYLCKNAPFDSKEEIRLVEGWQGEVYDRYKDQLTVWGSGKINVNTASTEVLGGLIKSYVTPVPGDDVVERVLSDLGEYKLLVSFKKEQDFLDWLKNEGLEVSSDLKSAITTSSTVFQVSSQGIVGDTTVTITAIMDYSSSSLGSVSFWKVE
jgi:type II secretory pathway component PulK